MSKCRTIRKCKSKKLKTKKIFSTFSKAFTIGYTMRQPSSMRLSARRCRRPRSRRQAVPWNSPMAIRWSWLSGSIWRWERLYRKPWRTRFQMLSMCSSPKLRNMNCRFSSLQFKKWLVFIATPADGQVIEAVNAGFCLALVMLLRWKVRLVPPLSSSASPQWYFNSRSKKPRKLTRRKSRTKLST